MDSKDFMLVCSEIIKQVLLDNLCISIDKDELGLEPIDKLGSEHPNSKQVAQYNKTTNELIKVWSSIIDVQRELGIDQSTVSKCCKGKYKSAGGFVWKYVEEMNEDERTNK